MAVVAGIKIKTNKKVFSARSADEKFTGGEPAWDYDRAICMDDDVFDHHLRQSFYYYNYYFSQKDCAKHVMKWAREHGKLTPDTLKRFEKSGLSHFPMTACSIIRAHGVGMPIRERERNYLLKCIGVTVEKTRAAYDAEVPAVAKGGAKLYVPTIQDRLAEKTSEVIGEIEGQVDNVFDNKPVEIKIYDYLTSKGVAQSQVGKIRAVFQRQIDEITEFAAGKDAQLKEAYAFLKKADLKRINDFYTKLMADLDSYTAAKKAVKKARVKKPVAKDKLVAKVKYMKDDKALKLVSINPVNVIGATELWCFDTKTRKIIKYVADSHAGVLGIKGTTITGFDAVLSVAKTLRKPADSLRDFMKTNKVQRRTFMKDIKAVEIKATGRLSENILLLKVD